MHDLQSLEKAASVWRQQRGGRPWAVAPRGAAQADVPQRQPPGLSSTGPYWQRCSGAVHALSSPRPSTGRAAAAWKAVGSPRRWGQVRGLAALCGGDSRVVKAPAFATEAAPYCFHCRPVGKHKEVWTSPRNKIGCRKKGSQIAQSLF